MNNLADEFELSATAVAGIGDCARDVAILSDEELLAAQQKTSTHRRHLDRYAAWIAAEIAHRSRRELGYAGLAQRTGFATAEALIQSVSHGTRAEAVKLVQVGTMIAETEAATRLQDIQSKTASPAADIGATGEIGSDDTRQEVATDPGTQAGQTDTTATVLFPVSPVIPIPWQAPIAAAVAGDVLSLDAAEAIRKGLGNVDQAVTMAQLRTAAEQLIVQAETLTVDQLHRYARAIRDDLDAAGISCREKEQRDARYLKLWQQPDGMFRLTGLLDPENGMILSSAINTVLSPRRGGPRFVDKAERTRADILLADERSNDQIAVDTLIDMVRLATDADPGTLFGSRRPAVRVIVTEHDLADQDGAHRGRGHLEGHPDAISIDTVHRHLCDTGIVGVKFDDNGQCVNVGRDQRLFTARQRIGLAVRDGGCRFPGCDRSPLWCEAHHINEWHRDRGSTNLADGVLLCRHHHMLIHNNHWQIIRDEGREVEQLMGQTDGSGQPAVIYWLKPPKHEDPAQRLRPMPSKSPSLRALCQQGSGAPPHPGTVRYDQVAGEVRNAGGEEPNAPGEPSRDARAS